MSKPALIEPDIVYTMKVFGNSINYEKQSQEIINI